MHDPNCTKKVALSRLALNRQSAKEAVTEEVQDDDTEISIVLIVGISVGGLIFVLLSCALLVLCWRCIKLRRLRLKGVSDNTRV